LVQSLALIGIARRIATRAGVQRHQADIMNENALSCPTQILLAGIPQLCRPDEDNVRLLLNSPALDRRLIPKVEL
jgi:hypothetical protein